MQQFERQLSRQRAGRLKKNSLQLNCKSSENDFMGRALGKQRGTTKTDHASPSFGERSHEHNMLATLSTLYGLLALFSINISSSKSLWLRKEGFRACGTKDLLHSFRLQKTLAEVEKGVWVPDFLLCHSLLFIILFGLLEGRHYPIIGGVG